LSGDALIDAHKDENISHSERERIKQMIVESRAKQAEMDVKTKQLHEQIAEARQKEAEISDKADTERLRAFCLDVMASTLEPVNNAVEASFLSITSSAKNAVKLAVKSAEAGLNALNKQLEQNAEFPDFSSASQVDKRDHQSSSLSALVEQENLIIKLKNDLQKEEREANAEIARIGELLKGLSKQGDDLSASILSLELAIAALGKVRTTFENTRQFWLGVEKQCKKLTKIEDLRELNSDPNLKEEFIIELNNTGLSWLTLGKINYCALLAIQKVDKTSDSIMNNLPTKQEALEIVQKDADMILKSLTE
jgi:predicted  nucleic acid-binding Zn-ribbon protein